MMEQACIIIAIRMRKDPHPSHPATLEVSKISWFSKALTLDGSMMKPLSKFNMVSCNCLSSSYLLRLSRLPPKYLRATPPALSEQDMTIGMHGLKTQTDTSMQDSPTQQTVQALVCRRRVTRLLNLIHGIKFLHKTFLTSWANMMKIPVKPPLILHSMPSSGRTSLIPQCKEEPSIRVRPRQMFAPRQTLAGKCNGSRISRMGSFRMPRTGEAAAPSAPLHKRAS